MRFFTLAAAALLLAACVSVLPEATPPSARYQVTDITVASEHAPVAWSLGVDDPDATLAFDTAKIALSREPARIEYYSGGQWVDRAPRLFGAALVRSFENTGVIQGVGSRIVMPVSTYVLQTDIRKLGVDHQGAEMTASIVIFARLTNGRSAVYAAKLFSASEPVRADNAGAAATALNNGLSRVQGEIVEWTIAEADKAASK
jgi:cholesterol transport system auxiliary component